MSRPRQHAPAIVRTVARRLLPRAARVVIRDAIELGKDAAARIAGLRTPARSDETVAGTPSVLIVDDLVPDPLYGAGFPRAFAIVRSLVGAGCRVEIYPLWSDAAAIARMDALLGGDVTVHAGIGMRGLRRLLWRRGASFSMVFVSRPLSMRAFMLSGWRPPRPFAPLIAYDAEAVITPRESLRQALFGQPPSPESTDRALRAELTLAEPANVVTAVTDEDRALIATAIDTPVIVLSHPVSQPASVAPFDRRSDLLFVGRLTGRASESPNVDSLLWFAAEVMPLLDRHIGDTYRLHVVGLLEGDEVQASASSRIVLHGAVEQLEPFYERCRVFVAPTRYAAGVPLKVVETMGRGLPCVTTPLLARQVGAHGHGFTPDPSAETFAASCARLYSDAAAWRDARRYGLEHVARHFSQAAFDAALDALLARAASARSG